MTRSSAEPDQRSIDRVAVRLFGSVFLVGALLLFFVAFGITRFPPLLRDGTLAYAIPGGGGHSIDARAVTVLGLAGVALLALAALSLLSGNWRRVRREPKPRPLPSRAPRRWRSRVVLFCGVVFLLLVMALRFAGGTRPPVEPRGPSVSPPLSQH